MKSFFNWLSGRYESSKPAPAAAGQAEHACGKATPSGIKPVSKNGALGVDRKVKRHARREQLYGAIRNAMSRAGVLSASFKFKVLSLDQLGDKFMVMMDVAPSLVKQADKLTEIEEQLTLAAKAQLSISVTAVYWRSDASVGLPHAPAVQLDQRAGIESGRALAHKPINAINAINVTPPVPRYDPIHDEELAAFRQALAAASAHSGAAQANVAKTRSGLRSPALLTGFEDTEMPESFAAPALSATQYGDLN